jgi:hypothetical protein
VQGRKVSAGLVFVRLLAGQAYVVGFGPLPGGYNGGSD